MRTGYRFAALLILSVACAELAAGCARPEAMRARDYFGEDIDFGFVTGHLVAAMKELDNKDHAPV